MKRRKRKRRRGWPTAAAARRETRISTRVVRANKFKRRQIRLRGPRMPTRRPVVAKSCYNLAMASRPSELCSSEKAAKISSHSSPLLAATRVVHFAGNRSTNNKQFMRSLWLLLPLLLSCLLAASNSSPHLQQHTAAAGEISARADELPTTTTTTEIKRADGLNFTTEPAETGHLLYSDTRQSVFVLPAPINERRRQTRETGAAANETATTPHDQDQRATDPLDMASLPAGSRLVLARESQQIELACDAHESGVGNNEPLTTRNEREFIILGANRTIHRLDRTDDADDQQRRWLKGTTQSNDEAHELTDRLVSLVFWYKDDDPAPIYTLDARSSAAKLSFSSSLGTGAGDAQRIVTMNKQLLGVARHYERNRTESGEMYDLRSKIKIDDWPVIKLQLDGLRGHHSGDYKCRVDFRRARTIRRVVRLFVEVPLRNLSLTASDNKYALSSDMNLVQTSNGDQIVYDRNLTQIVRVNQDQRVEFECRTNEGARPRPILSWLISWPPSNERAATSTEAEEFFASPDSHARLARLLNGSMDFGHKHGQLASHRKSSNDLGSKLVLNRLGRSMLGLRVGCRARQAKLQLDETADDQQRSKPANHAHPVSQGANSSTALELTKWLELELNLKPESVRISRLEQQQTLRNKATSPEVGTGAKPAPGGEQVQKVSLDEREPITFVCRSRGARPAARLSWSWLGGGVGGGDGAGEPLGRLTRKTSEAFGGAAGPKIIDKTNGDDEQESASQLEFPQGLARQWHGRRLLCTATNEATSTASESAAHLELDIRYKPSVQLIERTETGSQRRRRRFECRFQANPPINQLVWLVNGRPLGPARRLINKTNGGDGESDQAEIKQATGRGGASWHATKGGGGTVRKHNKLFRLESKTTATRESGIGGSLDQHTQGDDDGPMTNLTIDELEDQEESAAEPMAELKCVAANAVGERASEPIVWAASTTAEVKCTVDGQLAELRKGQPGPPAHHDSLLDLIEVHRLAPGAWPREDKFSCELVEAAHLNATRYAWSFVPFEQVPERASQLADGNWPLGAPAAHAEHELFSRSSELTEAAEKLQLRSTDHVRGLLACKVQLAGSDEWWPRSGPCLTLISADWPANDSRRLDTEEQPPAASASRPSAENCRIEPILVPARAKQNGVDRLAISVDCSAAPGKEALIFELGVARRPETRADSREAQTGDTILQQQQQHQEQLPGARLDDLMLLDERRAAPRNKTGQHQQRAKKLLFIERATDNTTSGYRRLALSDLIPSQDSVSTTTTTRARPRQSDQEDDEEPTKRKENERKLDDTKQLAANKPGADARHGESALARKVHRGSDGESAPHSPREMNSSIVSLNEQVELLNELVFTLRASDLVRVSAPRAIYGSELRLAKRAPNGSNAAAAAAPAPPTNARRSKSSQRGSSDNNGGSGATAPLSRSTELLQLLAGEQSATPTADLEGRGWQNVTRLARPTTQSIDYIVEWGRRHEIGITMAAIGATVLLSALTLTLIVLVLRRNQRNPINKSPSANGHAQRHSELVLMRSGSRVSLASRQHQPAAAESECRLDSTGGQTNDMLADQPTGYCLTTANSELAASLAGSQVCLSSQVDFLAPPARQPSGQRVGQLSTASSSSCATSYTLTNSAKRPAARQVRLNLSPQSMGTDLEDATHQTIMGHNDDDDYHYLGSLPRGYLGNLHCDASQNLPGPDLQVAHAPFCSQHQTLFFEQRRPMVTTDCSFEQSPGSLMSLSSEHATGSLSGAGPHQTCRSHLILAPANRLANYELEDD